LTTEHLGRRATILGQIEEASQFASGVKCYVDDGSGPVVVWIPQEIYEKLADHAGWRVGSLVRVTGRVEQYKDEIEIVPWTASDVFVVDAAAPLSGQTAPLAELNAARVGERVTVEAGIVKVESFSKGIKVLLDDGSGRITLLLWQNVHDVVPDREGLIAGATVRVAGEVQEYEGELEIVPGIGTDVVLVTRD
jgi:DNA/RNA endonuclease YhcR with UshA esterase domain